MIIIHQYSDVFREIAGIEFDTLEYEKLLYIIHGLLPSHDCSYRIETRNGVAVLGKVVYNKPQIVLVLHRFWYINIDDRKLPPTKDYYDWINQEITKAKESL